MTGQNVENSKLVMIFDETQVILGLFQYDSKYLPIFKSGRILSFLSTFWNLVQVVPAMCAMRTSVENKSAQGNLITTPVAYYYSDLFWTQGGSYWYKQETRHLSFLVGKNV